MDQNKYRYNRLFSKVEDFSSIGHPKDEYGFISNDPKLINIDELLQVPIAVISAPAWLGKSYFADEGLRKHLSYNMPNTRLIRSSFEDGYAKLTRANLEKLRNPNCKTIWIIDSLDEADKQCFGKWTEDLDKLTSKKPNKCQIIVMTRPSASRLTKTIDCLKNLSQKVQQLDLLPLDKMSAEDLVGNQKLFAKILLKIQDNESLQNIVGYPCILEYLKKNPTEISELNDISIWKRLLMQLLSSQDLGTSQNHPPKKEVFDAISQLAVIMTFSRTNTISIDPARLEYFGNYCLPRTQQYVQKSLDSNIYSSSVGKNYKFAKKNIQDWMCAWGLVKHSFNKIKPLITDANGFRPDLKDVIYFLARISEKENSELRQSIVAFDGAGILPSTMVAWSKDDGIRVLDYLEHKICDDRDWYFDLWGQDNVKNLATCNISDELRERITDKARSVSARSIFIEIAREVKVAGLKKTLINLLNDNKEKTRLKNDAIYFLIDTEDCCDELFEFSKCFQANNPSEKSLISISLNYLLDRQKIDLVTVIKYMPEVDSNWKGSDATSLLVYNIERQMTLDDAKALLKNDWWKSRILTAVGKNHTYEETSCRSNRAKSKFFELISSQKKYSNYEFEFICDIFESAHKHNYLIGEWEDKLLIPISNDLEQRKTFYTVHNKFEYLKRYILKSNDYVWLTKLLIQDPSDEIVFSHLDFLAHLKEQTETQAIIKTLRDINFDKAQLFEKRRRKYKQKEDDRKKYKNTKILEKEKISATVINLINEENFSLQQKMQELSFLCFSKGFSSSNVDGNWDDLDESMQLKVREICCAALISCESSFIPEGNIIPGSVWTEAYCFSKFTIEGWVKLNAKMITAWLPLVLASSVRNEEIIANCFKNDFEQTMNVLIENLIHEGGDSNHVIIGLDIPDNIWRSEFSEKVIQKIIQNTELNSKYRADTLRILKQKNTEVGTKCANQILAVESNAPALLGAAIDVMLVDGNLEVLKQLNDYFDKGVEILRYINSVTNYFSCSLYADWKQWRAIDAFPLLSVLFKRFPPEQDRKKEFEINHNYSKNDSWIELRQNMFHHIFVRNDLGDREVCKQLAGTDRTLLECMDYWEKREELNRVFSADFSENIGEIFSKEHLIDLLDQNKDKRICETEDHLLDIVLEELYKINKDVGRHSYLLFKGNEKDMSFGSPRHETALQQYLACRLGDRLNGVIIFREAEVHFGKKTDLEIIIMKSKNRFLSLIVEIKWSKNPDLSTSLSEQLGEKYLIDKTHGIYLVGYTGECKWYKQQITGENASLFMKYSG